MGMHGAHALSLSCMVEIASNSMRYLAGSGSLGDDGHAGHPDRRPFLPVVHPGLGGLGVKNFETRVIDGICHGQ
jgi:hypothetical protein